MSYEFADTDFAWNKNRDLRSREPFFSSGEYLEENQAALKVAFEESFEMVLSNLGKHGHDDEEVLHSTNGHDGHHTFTKPSDP